MFQDKLHTAMVFAESAYPPDSENPDWRMSWHLARKGSTVMGLQILFVTGHLTETLLRDYLRERLAAGPLTWFKLDEPFCTVDVSKLHDALPPLWPYSKSAPPPWPEWLTGVVQVAPVFEQIGKNRLNLRITEATYLAERKRALERDERGGVVHHTTIVHGSYFQGSPVSVADRSSFSVVGDHAVQTIHTGNLALPEDLATLALELAKLRVALYTQLASAEESSPELNESADAVAKAERAAKSGQGETAMHALKAAGKWAFDTATKIGVSVAAEAIKKAIGHP